jgi:hypothetical protein
MENDSAAHAAPLFTNPAAQAKSHVPEAQIRVPFGGAVQISQPGPQAVTEVSGTQPASQRWNPLAHENTQRPRRQSAVVPGGASAVQSTHTFVPQSSGVFVHGPSTTSAADGRPGGDGRSFDAPLPQATAARTAAIATMFRIGFSSGSGSESRIAADLETEGGLVKRSQRRDDRPDDVAGDERDAVGEA